MKNTLYWILALMITLASAIYQRGTGPTYEFKGTYRTDAGTFQFELPRDHGGPGDQTVRLPVVPDAAGRLIWRYYPTDRPWNEVPMQSGDGVLKADLPHQPPGGKLEYYILLDANGRKIRIPETRDSVIIRFKGSVDRWALAPHVLLMFIGMLVSNRTALEVLSRRPNVRVLTWITLSALTVGGLIMGPIVQYQAFGEAWTGFPVGRDLTDNKLAIAVGFWLIPVFIRKNKKRSDCWALIAAAITLIIFLIPHSLFGTELKYD
ncbi:hypothetical protein JXA40_07085 [bacterium]|nr:hypothetical protein [candidate division CSSED10-310 bacterium]